WAAAHGEELQQRTGRWPHAIFPACRLAALARSTPDRFERIDRHLAISDWLAFALCGEHASDPTQAGESRVVGPEGRRFADARIERLGLPRALFPAVGESGTLLGKARAQAAEELGVAPGAVVGVGGADSQCALVGADALASGDWCLVAGT